MCGDGVYLCYINEKWSSRVLVISLLLLRLKDTRLIMYLRICLACYFIDYIDCLDD